MKIKGLCLALLLLFGSLSMNAKHILTKGFLFGFASSFNDSTVYLTNIQEVDAIWVDSKSKFLYSKENYSYQLRDHLKDNGMSTPTCVTIFATKRKDIEKKYIALRKRYTSSKKQNFIVKYLSDTDFQFKPITLSEEENNNVIVKQTSKKRKSK
ncbi:hypothetical protein [Prevotella sp.]|uniref:hypothetical protein n=1 Tax=Prevotella sp. TaxID=59823 RepID=UPI002F94AC8C